LDALRFSNGFNKEPVLDKAVDFLLENWKIRKPIGPCHYGIGTLFMQIEYPFKAIALVGKYNIEGWIYKIKRGDV